MRKLIVLVMLLCSCLSYGQGVKMSAFPEATSVDTGKMRFVIVYDAGGSYLNQLLGVGRFARYMGSLAFTAGYGINNTSGIVKVDTSVVFPHALGTLAAGYGMLYSGRSFRMDTAVTFAKLVSTYAAGYGLTWSGRTYTTDTGVLFAKYATTQAVGYGLTRSGRTDALDSAQAATKALLQKKIDSLNAIIGTKGTVTSVGLAGSSTITISGTASPITTSGTYSVSIPSSVALPGSPTTTTQTAGDNSTKISTTSYVDIHYKDSTTTTTTGTFTPTTTVANLIYPVSYSFTALASNITIGNTTSTWAHRQNLTLYITGTSAKTIAWGTGYAAQSSKPLPTTTFTTQMTVLHFEWNSQLNKFLYIGGTGTTDGY